MATDYLSSVPFELLHQVVRIIPPAELSKRPWNRASRTVYHSVDIHAHRILAAHQKCFNPFETSTLYRGLVAVPSRFNEVVDYLIRNDLMTYHNSFFGPSMFSSICRDIEEDKFRGFYDTCIAYGKNLNVLALSTLLSHRFATEPMIRQIISYLKQIADDGCADSKEHFKTIGVEILIHSLTSHKLWGCLMIDELSKQVDWMKILIRTFNIDKNDIPSHVIETVSLVSLRLLFTDDELGEKYKDYTRREDVDPYRGDYATYELLVNLYSYENLPRGAYSIEDPFTQFVYYTDFPRILEDWLARGYPISADAADRGLSEFIYRGSDLEHQAIGNLERIAQESYLDAHRKWWGCEGSFLIDPFAYGCDWKSFTKKEKLSVMNFIMEGKITNEKIKQRCMKRMFPLITEYSE